MGYQGGIDSFFFFEMTVYRNVKNAFQLLDGILLNGQSNIVGQNSTGASCSASPSQSSRIELDSRSNLGTCFFVLFLITCWLTRVRGNLVYGRLFHCRFSLVEWRLPAGSVG